MFDNLTLESKKNLFIRASDLYHRGHESPITDAEFDELKRILTAEIPEWSPLKMTGVPPLASSPLVKVNHTVHMGSIANAMNEEEFIKWYSKVGGGKVTGNLKVDGASMLLKYRNGQLVSAATRGDGITGEDVTHHAIRMKDLPIFVPFTGTMYVRGEAVMKKSDWVRYKREVPEAKNARNSTAGIVGRKDSNGSQFISLLSHHVWFGEDGKGSPPMDVGFGYDDQMKFLVSQGFIRPVGGPMVRAEDCKTWYAQIEAMRDNAQLEYEIDGIVFIVDDQRLWLDLGIGGDNCPRGTIAWKFAAMTGRSRLVKIEHEVGNNGQITPVGYVEPVMIGGVTVTKASLSNYVRLAAMDVGIGEEVEVSRRGDVIPKIERRIGEYAAPRVLIEEPKECPSCGTPLVRNQLAGGGTGSITLCPSDECGDKPAGLINRWRRSLDIKDLGDEIITALLQSGHVNTPADLYRLKDVPLATLGSIPVNGKRLGGSTAEKIIKNIEARRNLTVDEILGSLSVPGLGTRKVQLIREAAVTAYGDQGHFLDTLHYWFSVNSPGQSMLQVYAGVLGIKNAWKAIQEGLDKRKPLVDDLLAAGVTVRAPDAPVAVAADAKLAGQSFCFSECRPTEEDSAKLVSLGAREASGVSKKTSYLVVPGPETLTGKVTKAKADGVQIITYGKFQEIIREP